MADYIVKDTELTSVANAIRTAGGTNSLLSFPNGFVSAVGNISGGGSSDFSTATVTVVNNIHSDAMCYAATVVEPPVPALPSTTTGFFNVSGNDTTTETVILYMGNCDMSFETSGILSGSGDVEIDGTNAYITGDCTITIS